MSTNTDVLRPLNRKTATMRGRAISQSKSGPVAKTGWLSMPGSLTQSFFARGEEQEANEYENLPIDDPTLVPPAVEFDSFDKIPRRRGSWFAIAVSMLVVAAIGFVTWRSFHYLSKPGTSVAAASRAMVQAPPAAPVAQPAPPAQSAAEASPAPVTKPAPVVEPPPITKPDPIVEPVPVPKPAPVAKQMPVAREPAKSETDDDEPVQVRKHAPLHGYVWSPEKRTLVPAEPVIEDLPSEAPRPQSLEGAPAQEPQPAPDPTTPAPFEPPPAASSSSPSTNQAPIIE